MRTVLETALFCIFLIFLSLCLQEIVLKEVFGVEKATEFLHKCDFLLSEFEYLLGDVVLEGEESWRLDLECRSSRD